MAVTKIVRSAVFIIVAGVITGAVAKTPIWPPCSEWPYCQPITHGNEDNNGQVKSGTLAADETRTDVRQK
ncbi:hypothetical protein D1914_15240 [Salmonella enterica]|nr:hypothetical protein [Salmonella enterica]EBU7355973.1 hypothetical protein [Salmonella enterica subsp. enterica serovar Poona]EBJ3539813.1 hypothetical protein [Salmonella enterica]EBL1738177.1 hypothetical protein [Salmonella enterica]ECA2557637.1 hypothetical protein [Salmonella enterica subsp. enterica serovar Poona]